MKNDKELIPVRISLVVSLIVIVIVWNFGEAVLKWVLIGSLVVFILFLLYFCAAQYVPRLRESKWSPFIISTAFIIYLGALLISLSFDKSLLDDIKWNPSMAGLGIAVFAFGFGLFMQSRKQQTKEASSESGTDASDLSVKLTGLNEKLGRLENMVDTLCKESQALARRLAQLDKEDKGKPDQTN